MPTRSVLVFGIVYLSFAFVPLAYCEPPTAKDAKGVKADQSKRTDLQGDPLPPGVTIVPGKSKTLLGNGSKGHIVLKAAPDAAPIEGVPISVLAHVSVNFVVKVSYSSQAIPVTVAK